MIAINFYHMIIRSYFNWKYPIGFMLSFYVGLSCLMVYIIFCRLKDILSEIKRFDTFYHNTIILSMYEK